MECKPSDLFVGVVEFFAVLLPGSLVVFSAMDQARTHIFGKILPALPSDTVSAYATFFVASYLLGHFIFMIASYLDSPSDKIRKRLYPGSANN